MRKLLILTFALAAFVTAGLVASLPGAGAPGARPSASPKPTKTTPSPTPTPTDTPSPTPTPTPTGDPDPCLGVDLDSDGSVDAPPAPGSDCLLVDMVVEPHNGGVVQFGDRVRVHAAVLWTPVFDPTRLDLTSLCFGDADAPSNRSCTPLCKVFDTNGDGNQDRECKWETATTGIQVGDMSACLTGVTTDGFKIEACAPMTT